MHVLVNVEFYMYRIMVDLRNEPEPRAYRSSTCVIELARSRSVRPLLNILHIRARTCSVYRSSYLVL